MDAFSRLLVVVLLTLFSAQIACAEDNNIDIYAALSGQLMMVVDKECKLYQIAGTSDVACTPLLHALAQNKPLIDKLFSTIQKSLEAGGINDIALMNRNIIAFKVYLSLTQYKKEAELLRSSNPLIDAMSLLNYPFDVNGSSYSCFLHLSFGDYIYLNTTRMLLRNATFFSNNCKKDDIDKALSIVNADLSKFPGSDGMLIRGQYVRMALISIAIAKYNKDYGRFPKDLGELAISSASLLDVFAPNKAPIIYKQDGNRWFIKSYGDNRADDGYSRDKHIPYPTSMNPDIVITDSSERDIMEFYKNKLTNIGGAKMTIKDTGDISGVTY